MVHRTSTHNCLHTYVCSSRHTVSMMYMTCMYECMYVCMYECMYVCMYVVCMYVLPLLYSIRALNKMLQFPLQNENILLKSAVRFGHFQFYAGQFLMV